MKSTKEAVRSRRWTHESGPRYWWHRLPGMDFVPPVYADLTNAEWEIMRAWYEETDRSGVIGECAVPLVSLLHGLVMGNRIERIVQLGTCSGYSSLLLGFMLRRMNTPHGLFTLDINPELCALTQAVAGTRWPNEFCHRRRGQLSRLDFARGGEKAFRWRTGNDPARQLA